MHDDITRDPGYVSQSECRTAQDCGTRWLAEWHHGVRHTSPESPAQIVGSLGHAVVAEHLLATHEGRDTDTHSALIVECEKRRYDGDIDDMPEVRRAEEAADTLLLSPKFKPGVIVTGLDGRPWIEERLRVDWGAVRHFGLLDIGALSAIFQGHRKGMEGQPDVVHDCSHAVYVDDYKFRQKADLGGAVEQSGLADPQGAYYKVLLRAAGLARPEVVFRQINVYAGEWLALEDFLREGSPYVTAHGIPSRDLKVLGMVAPDVWEEAWRALVERRRQRSLTAASTSTNRRKVPTPRTATDAEMRDAAAFADTLRRIPLVEVSEFRLDHSVCVEVVRDMLAAVAGHLALLRAGARPGRHLRTYQSAPCVRRYGCPVQGPCTAALGTFRLEEQLAEMAEDGRLRRQWEAARSATVADYSDSERIV